MNSGLKFSSLSDQVYAYLRRQMNQGDLLPGSTINIGEIATNAYREFVKEAKSGVFPAEEHKYKISGDIKDFETMFTEIKDNFK